MTSALDDAADVVVDDEDNVVMTFAQPEQTPLQTYGSQSMVQPSTVGSPSCNNAATNTLSGLNTKPDHDVTMSDVMSGGSSSSDSGMHTPMKRVDSSMLLAANAAIMSSPDASFSEGSLSRFRILATCAQGSSVFWA